MPLLASLPADEPVLAPRVELRLGPSFGQDVLGSEDTRRGAVYEVAFYRPEPRLRFRGRDGSLALTAYYMFTKGGGFEDIPVNQMRTFGLTAAARYPIGSTRDRFFAEAGWGICHNSITTRDLDSRINSTPFLGVGYALDQGTVTARWFHMSNGGTSGNNQGLNQLVFLVGVRI
jgi:hypothetical protein